MVRLVFRPYTHVRRTICTSVSLRTSTRISPGFILHKHSSPSFGSQHTCSSEDSSPEGSITADEELVKVIIQSISLCLKVLHSKTRTYVRLLGPCFKTGRMTTQQNSVRMNNGRYVEPTKNAVTFCEQQTRRAQTQRTNKNNPTSVMVTRRNHRCKHQIVSVTNTTTHAKKRHAIRFLLTISRTFHCLFKVLFTFPSRYLFAIGLHEIFSFRWILPPFCAAVPSNTTRVLAPGNTHNLT